MTLYADIARLPRDDTGLPNRAAFLKLDLPGPADIVEQFYFDHGAKEEFQEQYSNLNLLYLDWEELLLPATDLCAASVYPDFEDWVDSCASRAIHALEEDWLEFDSRLAVRQQWRVQRTWLQSPVFLDAALLGRSGLHLAEGHTRLGVLRGMVSLGLVASGSLHKAWVGKYRAARAS